MKHYKTTGKMGTANREYRMHPNEGLQCKDQAGGWFHSNYSMNSFNTLLRSGGAVEVK